MGFNGISVVHFLQCPANITRKELGKLLAPHGPVVQPKPRGHIGTLQHQPRIFQRRRLHLDVMSGEHGPLAPIEVLGRRIVPAVLLRLALGRFRLAVELRDPRVIEGVGEGGQRMAVACSSNVSIGRFGHVRLGRGHSAGAIIKCRRGDKGRYAYSDSRTKSKCCCCRQTDRRGKIQAHRRRLLVKMRDDSG